MLHSTAELEVWKEPKHIVVAGTTILYLLKRDLIDWPNVISWLSTSSMAGHSQLGCWWRIFVFQSMTRCTFGGFVLAPPFCSYHSYVKKRWSIIRDLTQQDGWKTQDGRKMKKWYARLCIPGLARRYFFNILPSWVVFQPSCCVSYLFIRSLQRKNWDFVQNRTNVKSAMTMKALATL